MSVITINDLPESFLLDRKAMLSIKGGTPAAWLFGAFKAFDPSPQSNFGSVGNVYQVTNNLYVDKLIDKSQSMTINNAGANSNITAVLLGL
jgi:hypothetical protein